MGDSRLKRQSALDLAAEILLMEIMPKTDAVDVHGAVRYVPVSVVSLVVVEESDEPASGVIH